MAAAAAALTGELKTELALVAAVSASHMSMPNHWLPYALVARAQNWSLPKALFLTFLGAFGHVSVTLLVMLAISEIGASILNEDLYRVLSTLFLLVGGIYYLYSYLIQRRRDACCVGDDKQPRSKSVLPVVDNTAVNHTAALSLVLLTSLSPCVGSMPVLLAVLSPPLRPATVLAAGLTLLVSAAAVMMALVAVSYVGAASLDFTRVRKHERLVMGLSLIVLAVFTFFIFSNHDHHHHGHDHGHDHHHHHEVGLGSAAVHEEVGGVSPHVDHHVEHGDAHEGHRGHMDHSRHDMGQDEFIKKSVRYMKQVAARRARAENGN
eukprot:GFKZ01006160.1.p1 GENE.GFKZ01006160.1~~GFKZ01006160.1.p1  ORF type:complete len:321 (+),score=45.28 GFKZ01006160.1:661-1623(+)